MHKFVLVPVPVLHVSMHPNTNKLEAGGSLNLTCTYDFDLTVDSPIEKQVSWRVNSTTVDIESSWIMTSSEGKILHYNSLTTSDTGQYVCKLTLSVEDQHMFVTVEKSPVLSLELDITVQSEDNLSLLFTV